MQLFRTTAVIYMVTASLVGSWMIVNWAVRLWSQVQAFVS